MLTDEQFRDLLETLKPRRSWWGKVVDSTVASLLAVLVLGFFAQIWRTTTTWQDSLRELTKQTDGQDRELRTTQDVLSRELAANQLRLDRLYDKFEDLVERLEESMDTPMTEPLTAPEAAIAPEEAIEVEEGIKGRIRDDVNNQMQQSLP